MSLMPIFGKITILSLNLVNLRVSHFHVSHLTHETFKLRLQNTLNMSKTARVYFGVLHLLLNAELAVGAVSSILKDSDLKRSSALPIEEALALSLQGVASVSSYI